MKRWFRTFQFVNSGLNELQSRADQYPSSLNGALKSVEFADYFSNVWGEVDGWLSNVGVWMLAVIANIQKEAGLVGGAVEIGCWEGRTLLLLNRLLSNDEEVIGYDLDLRDQLQQNLERFQWPMGAKIRLYEIDSMKLQPARLSKDCSSGIRIFHVDGYHTREVARNDLSLAFETTKDGGVVVLDDFFSITVPGVTEAYFELALKDATFGFLPFAIGGGKLFLTTSEFRQGYIEGLSAGMPISNLNSKDVSRLVGHEISIYELGS